jgi:hypothetical protein
MLLKGVAGHLNNQQKEMVEDIEVSNEKIIELIRHYEESDDNSP